MTPATIAHQALQYLEHQAKTGLDWELCLSEWAASKRLSVDDYFAVKTVVRAELVARGVLSLDDLPELPDEDYPDDDAEQRAAA